MYAHAIAQVEPPAVGIHLIWIGPHPWVYSPKGWSIQRREFNAQDQGVDCHELKAGGIAALRVSRELPLSFGTLILRCGLWPTSITSTDDDPPLPCDVFTLELDAGQRSVQVDTKAKNTFAFALREGKVVAADGPAPGSTFLELSALAIDTIIVYVIQPSAIKFCLGVPLVDEQQDWAGIPFIVKDLQLPMQELIPTLDNTDKEFDEGKSRLLAGESLSQEEFKRLVETLRPGIKQAGPPRPLDQVLLMREDPADDFEEMIALDPIRVLMSHPKWRRVLGFGWFDDDPSLIEGKSYEYRITGLFPAEDIKDQVYGFHSIPSQTLLPAEFYLHDLRLRLPEPTVVQHAPDTPASGLAQISRRGIVIQPKKKPWWTLIPSLEDHSLVVDFPSPVTSVIFELHEAHDLEVAAYSFLGIVLGPDPMPPGERPRLDFPIPIKQLRLRGEGFLFAIRVPSGDEGMQPISIVLPSIRLVDTPRPQPPLLADIKNLQQPQPQPIQDNSPPITPPRRPALGFEVTWRPALRDGLAIWPPDADAAPPLDATLFQIEHRQETFSPDFPIDVIGAGEINHNKRAFEAPALGDPSRPSVASRAELIERLRKSFLPDLARQRLVRALASEDTETVHRLARESATPWQPLLPEENWTLGDRSPVTRDEKKRLHPGVNVMAVFPEVPRRGDGESLDLFWRDVFDFEEGGNIVNRPVPTPGTFHRYRVRTVDPVGRASLNWTETNLRRLEKHVPPPVPVGPDQTPADQFDLPKPTGVYARVIVKGTRDLTPEDIALLGPDDNVIELHWAWHEEQREQDAFATEFRVYLTDQPLDVTRGALTAVNPIGLGIYEVTIQLERHIVANAAKDGPLEAGYPFVIYSHTEGTTITAIIGTRVQKEDGSFHQPAPGSVELHTHFTPDLTRPAAWSERFKVDPITAESEYSAIFRNRLNLTPEHPRDSIWVGVSSANDQAYIPDQLAPTGTLSGNESAIVPVLCEARYRGRPEFDVPPTLDQIPVLLTPEGTDKTITFDLDLTPYLATTGLTGSDKVRPERVSAGAVFTAYFATTDNRVMAKAIDPQNDSEIDEEITNLNPGDIERIVSALNGNSVDALEDQFVLFLAASHPYRDRLFVPVTAQPVSLGPFQESLSPQGDRYVYRLRLSDAAGHLSAGGAMAKVVVRVPTLTAGAVPDRADRTAGDGPETLRFRVNPDPLAAYLLTFSENVANGTEASGEAVVLRVPNRPDLYPSDGIRLRNPEGFFLTPQVKPLAAPDVVIDADGIRHISLDFSASPGERVHVWACTLTQDGVPSRLNGPWALIMPPSPLPVPALVATTIAPEVIFTWTWPASEIQGLEVALEQSLDGVTWHRISPFMSAESTSYTYRPHVGDWQYRISVMTPTGRTALGDPVTPL